MTSLKSSFIDIDQSLEADVSLDDMRAERGLFLVLLVFALVVHSRGLLSAAEITCLDRWGNFANHVDADWYPSGRRPNPTTCLRALIKGPITSGDSQKFAELLHENHPFLGYVLLSSPGGSVEEAMKIGRLIRKALLISQAPDSPKWWPPGTGELGYPPNSICRGKTCYCASACFLIWSAGYERWGTVLGLHRPTIKSTASDFLAPETASVLYHHIALVLDKYLTDMEVPRWSIEAITSGSSTDIQWLSHDQARSMSAVPSIDNWIATVCGARHKYLDEIEDANERYQKRAILSCEFRKIRNARDAVKDLN